MSSQTLGFIKSCIKQRRILWTYHINMRLKERAIPREIILSSVDSFEIIEQYPEDKYLPSCLVYAEYKGQIFHIQVATNLQDDNVTIITAYRPTLDRWESDFKKRKKR